MKDNPQKLYCICRFLYDLQTMLSDIGWVVLLLNAVGYKGLYPLMGDICQEVELSLQWSAKFCWRNICTILCSCLLSLWQYDHYLIFLCDTDDVGNVQACRGFLKSLIETYQIKDLCHRAIYQMFSKITVLQLFFKKNYIFRHLRLRREIIWRWKKAKWELD